MSFYQDIVLTINSTKSDYDWQTYGHVEYL